MKKKFKLFLNEKKLLKTLKILREIEILKFFFNFPF